MIEIRGITQSDYEYLVSVLDRWWGGPSGQHAHPMFFHEFGDHALVAESDGEIVGFLLGFMTERPVSTGYVHLVGIHPEHRRKGVGKALYARFTERCREAGAERLKTVGAAGHDGPREFHAALGFTVTDEPDYAGRGRARIVYTKDL